MTELAGRALLDAVHRAVVGREREGDLVVAALATWRHVLLEGPPGTGKSTLLRAVATATGRRLHFVEGNAELTPARLLGAHDPALVLAQGYTEEAFVDGPLLAALRDGGLLYVEELNRVPEETLNVLITAMSEREVEVPRLGRVQAAPGFTVVGAMNPFDSVGTARLSSALYDRTCRVAVGYQSADEERIIATRSVEAALSAAGLAVGGGGEVDDDGRRLHAIVELVRATRSHPDLRHGASVRAAIDLELLCRQLAELRGTEPSDAGVTRDAAHAALSGRVRIHEGAGRTADQVVDELWRRHLGPGGAGRPPEAPRGKAGAR